MFSLSMYTYAIYVVDEYLCTVSGVVDRRGLFFDCCCYCFRQMVSETRMVVTSGRASGERRGAERRPLLVRLPRESR